MTSDTRDGSSRTMQWVQWIARGIGSLVVALWIFTGAVSAIAGSDPWTWESTAIVAFTAAAAAGVALAWRWEGIGGILLLLCGAAYSTFAGITAGHNRAFAIAITGGPLILSGVLFLIHWWGTGRGKGGLCGWV